MVDMIIYKTTNKINGKIYVGKDAANDPTYIGSGMLLASAIKKYGRENFVKTIIEVCESLQQLDEREVYWIRTLNATDRHIGYNIAKGGTGGNTSFAMDDDRKTRMLSNRSKSLKRTFASAEYRKRRSDISKQIWSRSEHVEKIRRTMMGRKITWANKIRESNQKWADSHPRRTHTPEVRSIIAKSSKRTYVQLDPTVEDRIIQLYTECGPRRMSEKLRSENISVSPYIIRRTLKKRGVYEKFRKMRPELKA